MIEKGIPIPGQLRTPHSLEAEQMEVGDSRLCDTMSERDTCRRRLAELGRKCVTRKTREGFRIWRVA